MPLLLPLAERVWYSDHWLGAALAPLGWAFAGLAATRRALHRVRRRGRARPPVPVIVVGNLSVGGTGKTPLVAWIARDLAAAGWRPGIVSRGHGGTAHPAPRIVRADDDPLETGDEPVLLARRAGVAVLVDRDRSRGAAALAERHGCDVVVSDDGLQHYALDRDLEIAVVDGVRGLGNRRCLPAGPLREPPGRLGTVDAVVVNEDPAAGPAGGPDLAAPAAFAMRLRGTEAVSLAGRGRRALGAFAGTPVHAVAGIGHPERFFRDLEAAGLEVRRHPFPDHHRFRSGDLPADGLEVLMTEKDAVKCEAFARSDLWAVPVDAEPDAGFGPWLRASVAAARSGSR